jgi:hypothetical protein
LRKNGEAMREQARSAERPNEEQSDEWLDRLVRRLLVAASSIKRLAHIANIEVAVETIQTPERQAKQVKLRSIEPLISMTSFSTIPNLRLCRIT